MKISVITIRAMAIAAMALFLSLIVAAPVRAQFEFDECSATEAWMPYGNGLPGRVIDMETMGNSLYALHTTHNSLYTLSVWKEAEGWSEVSHFKVLIDDMVTDMQAYRGELYVAGRFGSVDDKPGTGSLVKWDGSAWSGVPESVVMNHGIDPGRFRNCAMTVFRDQLIVSGSFLVDNGQIWNGIASWNGSAWRMIAKAIDSLYITSLLEWQGNLYVSGVFSNIEGVHALGIARWDGASWSAVGTEDMREMLKLFVYEDKLYSVGVVRPFTDPVVRWNGVRWERMPGILPKQQYDRIHRIMVASHDGSLYITAERYDLWRYAVRWDGAQAHRLPVPNQMVTALVSHKGELVAGGNFTSSCGMPLAYTARLCTTAECLGISGRVMDDSTGDCDNGERREGIAGRIIELLPGPRYAATDGNGYYRFTAEPGTYTLRLAPRPHWRQTCPEPSAMRSVTIGNGAGFSTGNNFGEYEWPKKNLAVGLSSSLARPGRELIYTVICSNTGDLAIPSPLLRFRYDGRLALDKGATPATSRSSPGLMEWDLADIGRGEQRKFTISLTVPTSMEEGTSLCAYAFADVQDDLRQADNTDRVCPSVRTSYDPNDLAVFPMEGDISPRDTVLTYTVRFQNTGSDTAFRVVVFDTLSPHLNIVSLQLGVSSHPYRLKLGAGGALIFDFDGIDLPHRRENEAASQGFFKFALRVQPDLPAGTTIQNRASIYFDYNWPILTNSVLSRIQELVADIEPGISGTAVTLHPNPARDLVHLRGAIVPGSTVEIWNMLGEIVKVQESGAGNDLTLDLAGLPAGKYMIAVETKQGHEMHAITVLR